MSGDIASVGSVIGDTQKRSFKNFMGYGRPKTDIERVMTHFNMSKEEIEKLNKEELQKLIDKLPPRGTGL